MAGSRETLVLLTQAYPFGRKAETFLEAELSVLARSFEQVIVLPSLLDDHVRRLPDGVRCETFLAGATRRDALRELARSLTRCTLQYGRAVASEGSAKAYVLHPKTYLGCIGKNAVKYRLLADFVQREELQEALFYDYWLENSTLALSWLRREGLVGRAVARAHGFDVYDERWPSGAVPFQAFKLESLDRVFPISAHGRDYLARKHPAARPRLSVSRLGVEANGGDPAQNGGDELLVVSCASLHPTKRVETIPAVLAAVGLPLRWVHFGDGPSRGEVERAARLLPERVKWRLAGHLDHDDLLDFYRRHRVDLFLSLSANEGLPVSIMEAISFGIPVLAVGVDGVPEIVTESTGRLVEAEDPAETVAAEARRLLEGEHPPREEIVAFFRDNFEAERNFGAFASMLRAV